MPILATPSTPTEVAFAPASFPGLAGMTWTGWDGSDWQLLDVDNSGVLLSTGIRGLNMPNADRYTSTSPALAGSRYRGSRTNEREVFWPVGVFSSGGSQAWLDYDRAFWRTMDPSRPGVWTVTQPDGTQRTLTCRFLSDGDHTTETDPSASGWEVYGITLVAEQPYWRGDPVVQKYGNAAPSNFFGGGVAAGGPPFVISSGSTVASAKVSNPGDVESFPVWTISNPAGSGSNVTYAKVGISSAFIEYSAPITPGSTITIDTRPDALSVTDQNGADRIGNLGSVAFAAIPAGTSVPLSLAVTGPADVTVQIDPLYHRAW